MQVRNVVGDGNCLYRAVSIFLYGFDKHEDTLRDIVCQEFVKNRGYYEEYVVGPWDDFILLASTNKYWMGNLALAGISNVYGISIKVYNMTTSKVTIINPYKGIRIPEQLHLIYINNNHYNLRKYQDLRNFNVISSKFGMLISMYYYIYIISMYSYIMSSNIHIV